MRAIERDKVEKEITGALRVCAYETFGKDGDYCVIRCDLTFKLSYDSAVSRLNGGSTYVARRPPPTTRPYIRGALGRGAIHAPRAIHARAPATRTPREDTVSRNAAGRALDYPFG